VKEVYARFRNTIARGQGHEPPASWTHGGARFSPTPLPCTSQITDRVPTGSTHKTARWRETAQYYKEGS